MVNCVACSQKPVACSGQPVASSKSLERKIKNLMVFLGSNLIFLT